MLLTSHRYVFRLPDAGVDSFCKFCLRAWLGKRRICFCSSGYQLSLLLNEASREVSRLATFTFADARLCCWRLSMKRIIFRFAVLLLLSSGFVCSANAATLYTSSLFASTGNSFVCDIRNTTGTTITVTGTIFDNNGAVAFTTDETIAPNGSQRLSVAGPGDFACKITAPGKLKALRGIAYVQQGGTAGAIAGSSEAR